MLVDVSGYISGGIDPRQHRPGRGDGADHFRDEPVDAHPVLDSFEHSGHRRGDDPPVDRPTAPRSVTEGSYVADVLVPQTRFTDRGLAPATPYCHALFAHDCYALFAHDGAGNTATGRGVTGASMAPPIWAWGNGTSGELGNGTTSCSAVPARVSGPTNATAVAGGVSNGFAVGADGVVWSWGDGSDGRLGNGRVAPATRVDWARLPDELNCSGPLPD